MSVRVNLPDISLLVRRIASCSSRSSGARSISPLISPIPSRREMNLSDSNFSISPIFSPSPTKTIGAPVVETALSAPPPLAVPSNLVTIVPVTPTSSWNVSAIGPAACPTCASITRNLSEAFAIRAISSNSSFSSPSRLSLPAVSMITISDVPTFFRPFLTISDATLDPGSPYTSTPVSSSI